MGKKTSLRTLSWAEAMNNADDPHLYVVNNTKTPDQPARKILFEAKSTGDPVTVSVPPTWIPVDIASQAERMVLLRNPAFRRLEEAGQLRIVDSDQAKELFAQDRHAAQELARLGYADNGNAMDVGATNEISDSERQRLTAEADPQVMELVRSANRGDRSVEDVEAMLHGLDLTEADIRWITGNAESEALRTYAAEQAED